MSLFVFVLVYNRHELRRGQAISGFAKAVRCLTGGYKDKYYWWASLHLSPTLVPALIATLTLTLTPTVTLPLPLPLLLPLPLTLTLMYPNPNPTL